MARSERWAGVDVGGRRKNFHVAVLSGAPSEGHAEAHSKAGLLERPTRLDTPGEVVGWLAERRARVVAVDSPRASAPPSELSRPAERELACSVCGIRFTPNEVVLRSHPGGYYDWVLNGLELYGALTRASAAARWEVIECFPTASFTRLGGPRGSSSRAAWTRGVLGSLGLAGLPRAMSQDERDAVMAAVTARAYGRGEVESFGEIFVPVRASACAPSETARPTTRTSRLRARS